MAPLEAKTSCSGLCRPALFFFTKNISTTPNVGCINQVLNNAATGYTVPGTITIIASIVMLVIFIFQYCLWCEKKEPEWNN